MERQHFERARKSLQHLAPPNRASGDPKVARVLEHALFAASREESDALTHGFHAYPARMHRAIAREVIAGLGRRSDVVLDPFCGGGTVLVEAAVRGMRAAGVDLNPFALRLCEVKVDPRTAPARARFTQTLTALVEGTKERVRSRERSTAPVKGPDAERFEHHVLRELGCLWEEIQKVKLSEDRRVFEVVLSAILTKVSKQRADTTLREVPKRIGRFIPTELFGRKGQELVERWEALDDEMPNDGPLPRLFEGDARELRAVLGPDREVDLVITSPPYGGTYDYHDHHAHRMPWLNLDAARFRAREIGARRNLRDTDRWDTELKDALGSIAAVTRAGGLVVVLQGDGEIAGRRVPADQQLAHLGPQVGLYVVAQSSAPRTDWHGGAARSEHLVALEKR